MEVWKDVVGYEGRYQVSNQGRVKSLDSVDSIGRAKTGKVISVKRNNRGYVQVHLHRDGKCAMKLMHRIVAEAFIDNPNGYDQVNHINENKADNQVENLEWCTNMYNRHHGSGIERMARNRDYKLVVANVNKAIAQIDKMGNTVNIWKNISEAKRHTGVNDTSISFCCRGKQRTAGGYFWRYAE